VNVYNRQRLPWKLAPHFSDIIGTASEIRNESDYEDFYVASASEAFQQLENAKLFFSAVTEYTDKFLK